MTTLSWKKNLSVDRRIVRLLSAKTYDDFPGALKELVSNAYDADATRVILKVNIKDDFIEVVDNGNGMTPSQFDFFLRIAGQQRGRNLSPVFGRKRIGQFGIGFLAFFPFGRKAIIKSSARNSEIQFTATIPTEGFMTDGEGSVDVGEIPINGTEVSDKSFIQDHGTTIRLEGLTSLVELYFKQREETQSKRGSQYTIRRWDPEERLRWWLEENLPLPYEKGSIYFKAFSDLELPSLSVSLNGKELVRNSPGTQVLESSTWEYHNVKCRYVIATENKPVLPFENRFLKKRLQNVGVGERDHFDLGVHGKTFSRLSWLTGEIHILSGLNTLISIDRSKFYDTPETDTFREFFEGRLRYFALLLEDVDKARREISQQLTESRAAEVGEKRRVIEKNLEVLKNKGFEIVRKSVSDFKNNVQESFFESTEDVGSQILYEIDPVEVDLDRRIVEVIEDHPTLSDFVTMLGEQHMIRFGNWDYQKYGAVRIAEEDVIEINQNYPIFNSRRYGEVIKRVLILLVMLAEEENLSKEELIHQFMVKLPDEFSDIR